MATESAHGPVGVICPGCESSAARTVQETRADPESVRSGLSDRLAPGPGAPSRGDGWLHFVEGMLMTAVGVAIAYSGMDEGKPLYTVGGTLVALLLFVGTIVVIRGENRQRAVVGAGEPIADRLWQPAYYCPGCASVFCPGGVPWQGLLTPEQFKKFVWAEAGYGKDLETDFKDVAVPPGILTRPGGVQDHG